MLSVFSCRNTPLADARLEQLAQAFQALDCRRAALEATTRLSWDAVVEQLDARLPEDMPPAEKHNMLMVRNAGLIRMFETYRELPDSVQVLVTRAEQKDKEIVAALRDVKTESSALEKEKRALFLSIEKQSKEKLPEMRRRFEAMRNTPCP